MDSCLLGRALALPGSLPRTRPRPRAGSRLRPWTARGADRGRSDAADAHGRPRIEHRGQPQAARSARQRAVHRQQRLRLPADRGRRAERDLLLRLDGPFPARHCGVLSAGHGARVAHGRPRALPPLELRRGARSSLRVQPARAKPHDPADVPIADAGCRPRSRRVPPAALGRGRGAGLPHARPEALAVVRSDCWGRRSRP